MVRIAWARSRKSTSPMRRFAPDDEVDYLIVGVGSAGGVLLQRLARAGFRVVGFDAGPFWDTERDWVSDEAGSHNLYWNDLRITGGERPAGLWRQQQRQGRRRRLGALGRLHAALPSLRLPRLLRGRRRRRLADLLPGPQAVLRADGAGDSRRRARLLSLGRPARLSLRPAPDGRRRRRADRGCTQLGIGVVARRPRRHHLRLARRPAALHLPRLLHPGLQGRREAEHAHQPRARRHPRTAPRFAPTAWSPASTWARTAA